MKNLSLYGSTLLLLAVLLFTTQATATKLDTIKVVDKDYLMLVFVNGKVELVDDGQGHDAFTNHADADNAVATHYGSSFHWGIGTKPETYTISSEDDPNYNNAVQPEACYRKTMMNGMKQGPWQNNDFAYEYTHDQMIFLELPFSMADGKTYTITIDEQTNTDRTEYTFTYDIFQSRSEALHVNVVGYLPESRMKSADLYMYMGEGGSRDFSAFAGNKVYIYNVDDGSSQEAGSVVFWKESANETHWNLTGSDVWTVDFSGFDQPGTYRLAVEGIGCSDDFEIRDDIYRDPFDVCVRGYFYMRIGQDNLDMSPVPRRPLYIPGVDPPACKVVLTTMHPYHPEWGSLHSGDNWDAEEKWAPYAKPGNPTNPNAYGGHSDALDWDRHLGHVSNSYDLLLVYILTGGALANDDFEIAESGNGIPDVIDEARNEVDFWLRLRDGLAYSHGLTNPTETGTLYQAGCTPIAAWANALNSAMLANAFMISGHTGLMETYRDSAIVAYNFAESSDDPMYGKLLDVGQSRLRGLDMKMMTAAFLYNVTGDTSWEDVVSELSVVDSPASEVFLQDAHNQLWGTAAYLLTKREVNYPELQENMRQSIINNAYHKEAAMTESRPSRRGYANDGATAWFQTCSDMPRTLIGHAVAENLIDKVKLLDALVLEADWTLGRNPINTIQMTTASTPLAGERSIEMCYTTGQNDGTPGLHPGHTPYLNMSDWGGNMVMGNPSKLGPQIYPPYEQWPHAALYLNTPYVYAHSEFTPRQTMRFKTMLYGYLYSLGLDATGDPAGLFADAGPDQALTDMDGDGVEPVTLNGAKSFVSDGTIVKWEWSKNGESLGTGKMLEVDLEVGRHEIELQVQDSKGETAADDVMIEIKEQSENMLNNGGFEQGNSGWNLYPYVNEAAAASFAIEDGVLHASIDNGGTERWHIQWNQPDLTIYQGATYRMRFDVWGDGERDFNAEIGMQGYPYTIFAGTLVQVTTERQTVVMDFTMMEPTHSASRYNFNCGLSDVDLYFDNAALFMTGEPASIADEAGAAGLPGEYALLNSYPNPFNPECTIRYDLPETADVKITVYDILGNRVRTLEDGVKNAGRYDVDFDASDLTSGVYIYTIQAGTFRSAKKMLLLK